jgi:acyl-coenzyme A synthetase/AMP-(fatty) acid ligase
MPMIPEAIFAMLASARIGAIHSVVFGGKNICSFLFIIFSINFILLKKNYFEKGVL